MPPLPKNVERRGNSYFYRQQTDGKRTRVYLSEVSEGEHGLYSALARVHKPTAHTVTDLVDSYLVNAKVKPITRKSYVIWAKDIKSVFGHQHPHDLKATDIAQMLDAYEKAGKPVTGNRVRAVLSAAYTYGLRTGMVETTPFTVKIARNREKPRRRYVRDAELEDALNRTTEAFRDFLEIAYLTGLRQKDLRELTKSQLTDEGIQVEESKTGKRVIIQWTDRLREAVRRAVVRSDGTLVLVNSRGRGWTVSGLQSAMKRLDVDWTLHDIRAKAESDSREGLGLLSIYKRDRRVGAVK